MKYKSSTLDDLEVRIVLVVSDLQGHLMLMIYILSKMAYAASY